MSFFVVIWIMETYGQHEGQRSVDSGPVRVSTSGVWFKSRVGEALIKINATFCTFVIKF